MLVTVQCHILHVCMYKANNTTCMCIVMLSCNLCNLTYHMSCTHTIRNMLYVYPLSLDFRSGKGRNIGVRVHFLSGEEKEDVCPAIYGKSCSPSYLREAWCPVIYHNR